MYLDAIAGDHSDVAKLAGLIEPNPGRLAVHVNRLAAAGMEMTGVLTGRPDDLEDVIAGAGADRAIITSPDFTHAGLIVRCLDAGVDVVVEKPLTIDEESCAKIADAAERNPGQLVVTFNYRYSPRNSAVRQVIADGRIGDVTSVHFEWALDTIHGADYFRRWHRRKHESGGLLVHKSTHHFDLVNWWLAASPELVFSQADLRAMFDENE